MSVITIHSDNPNLSYILSKNPLTQTSNNKPFSRNSGDTTSESWFLNNNQSFRLYYSKNKFCHDKDDFSYLDFENQSSPAYVISAINDHLRSAYAKRHDMDTEYPCQIEFQIQVPRTSKVVIQLIFEFLDAKFLKTDEIQYSLDYDSKILTVKYNSNTIYDLLNTSLLLCYTVVNETADTYSDSQLVKYFKILCQYTQTYMLLRSYLSRAQNFKDFSEMLNAVENIDFTFKYGNNFAKRMDAIGAYIRNKVTNTSTMVEIGCGEGAYFKMLSKLYANVISLEADTSIANFAAKKIIHKQLDNVDLQNVTVNAEFIANNVPENSDVLITEVLEHMPLEEAKSVMNALLSSNARRIIATVPNRSFNTYYNIPLGEVRHDDHKWEPNWNEIHDYLENEPLCKRFHYEMSAIGDTVKDDSTICSTIMITFERRV